VELIHKYAGSNIKPLVPSGLNPSLLAAYSGRYLGDYAVPMTNAVTNGDFSNGTTGWTTYGGSTISALNNTILITGDGTGVNPRSKTLCPFAPVIGKVVILTLKFKVTNALCTSVKAQMKNTTGSDVSIEYTLQTNPVINTVYSKQIIMTLNNSTGATCGPVIGSYYADAATANGKVMEVQEVMCIDLSTLLPLNEPTATELTDMLTYKGKTFWNGTENVVINPIINGQRRYYWCDQSGNGRHLHLVNLAYDSTGGQETRYPTDYLFDGVNDYPIHNSATDIRGAQSAFSVFGVYQAKGAFASPHRLFQLSDAGTTLCGDLAISATAVTFTVQDSTSGTSVATITATNALDTWYGITCTYDPVTKKAGISRNGSAITLGSALTNGSRKFNRIVMACNYLLSAFNNVRVAELQPMNKALSDAECKSIYNNVASRYSMPRV
jgi:hypothetical protein